MSISAPELLIISTTSEPFGSFTSTTSFRYFPIPSLTGALETSTPRLGTSIIFAVLLGCAEIASERSEPTFLSLTSKAATNSISLGSIPPIE